MSYYNEFLKITQNPANHPYNSLFHGRRSAVIDLIKPVCGKMRESGIHYSTDITYITDNLGTVSIAWFERGKTQLINLPFDDNM